ncbi:ABC transporter substrate-binding protein [Ramlibacter tataouinensis]|uniref:Candidate ABC type nitrate/sulfonate/bicarbonate transport system, periplasmic component n=1 Tax=Ramlibacter tataouinensis (strain ATCC BAA-407 / DSM 14655 / LMG 21543 / TTB310) TaxID=365046 RepID=F5Y0G4_RAMTT|nr:ABC transporter substrate-binding protein [Ramlibacter tataouinensis]AEG93370.1 candidate ABC type nitrate/sulfonate/bicarbonate transport system, periplasmic component [Ramlibacter tataouinensis TTB310]
MTLRRHLLLAAAMAGLSSPVRAQAPARLDRLVVAGWSKPITEVVPLLVDADKGFYRAQGITLEYVPGAGGGDAVRNLLGGQADVAFTDPGSFFAALDKGEKLRAIYDIYPQNVFNVVSLRRSGIRQPADLKGKRIGVYSLASGTRQNLQVLLHQVGLSEADVTVVVTGLLNFAPLLQGQVDATAATDTGLAIGRRRGIGEVDVMEVGRFLNVSSDLYVVREETYQRRKDLLRRFLRAYRDSAAWMIAQPAEAARLAALRAIDASDPALALEIIQLRNAATVSDRTRREGLGALDVATLQRAADVYRQLGLVQRPIDISQVVAGDLLPGH